MTDTPSSASLDQNPPPPPPAAGDAAAPSGPSKRDLLIGGAVVAAILLILVAFLVVRSDGSGTKAGSSTTVSLPKDMLQLGIEYQQAGKLDDAKKAYNAVLLTDPTNKFALYNLGLVAQTQGDNTAALRYYDQALAQDPKMDTAIYNRALALRDLGRLDEAVIAFRGLLAQGESVGVLYNLGNILISQGKAAEGAALVARADALQKAGGSN